MHHSATLLPLGIASLSFFNKSQFNSRLTCWILTYKRFLPNKGPNAVEFIINHAEVSLAFVHESKLSSVSSHSIRTENECSYISQRNLDRLQNFNKLHIMCCFFTQWLLFLQILSLPRCSSHLKSRSKDY
jgi:hypothetical protein